MIFKQYFHKLKQLLIYFDFEPLLFVWVVSDVLNNMVLWTSFAYWQELEQPNTYWLYFSYLIGSLSMLICLHNKKWLARCIAGYLILYLFSTIRYLVDIVLDAEKIFNIMDAKNILITCWYAAIWIWVLIKVKKENLHKELS